MMNARPVLNNVTLRVPCFVVSSGKTEAPVYLAPVGLGVAGVAAPCGCAAGAAGAPAGFDGIVRPPDASPIAAA